MAQMMIQEREPVEKIEKYTGYTLEMLKEIADTLGEPLNSITIRRKANEKNSTKA